MLLIFGPFWQFWVIFGNLGKFWVIFWAIWGSFWVIFGPFLVLIFCCKYASVLFKSLFATLIPKNMQNKKMMKFYFVNGSIVVGSVSVFIGSTIQIDNPDHHLNQSSVTCQPDPSSGLSSFIWIVISGCWSAIIGSAIISLRFVVVGCNILNAWSPFF